MMFRRDMQLGSTRVVAKAVRSKRQKCCDRLSEAFERRPGQRGSCIGIEYLPQANEIIMNRFDLGGQFCT